MIYEVSITDRWYPTQDDAELVVRIRCAADDVSGLRDAIETAISDAVEDESA